MNHTANRYPTTLPPVSERTTPLFPLGQLVATPAVLEHCDRYAINVQAFVHANQCGRWGQVPPEDAAENDFSVLNGFRVLSSYEIAGEKVWLITEADRSVTTLLFPMEY